MPRSDRNSINYMKYRSFYHRDNTSYSDEHDDPETIPSQRRIMFKVCSLKPRTSINSLMAKMAIKSHFEDDDILGDYSIGNHHNRISYRNYKGSTNSVKKLLPSAYGWYQVTIPFGQKYNKNEIIQNILSAITPNTFKPHYWRENKSSITFFVDDIKIAERLQNIDCTIQMPDGFNLLVKVCSGIPTFNCDDQLKEKIELVIAKRYNEQTKALDLSKFHADPDFIDIFCGLFNPIIISAVFNIIEENIPDVEAINLNNNQIQILDVFDNVSQKLPNLKILHLADNRIYTIANLSINCGASIVELVLTNNPLRNHYKKHSVYVKVVRRKFPKLLKLDGQHLDPVISCELDGEHKLLPKPNASFFCNPNGVEIVREFLKQYFHIYDSDNRQPLIQAYHEQATISLSCPLDNQNEKLSIYMLHNRNLIRTQADDAKFQLLKTGRLSVVSFLSDLPKTQHDIMSFSVDLSVVLPTFISFTVAGLFKELSNDCTTPSTSSKILSFQRHIVIVPGSAGGFVIRNEMILIINATNLQIKTAFKQPIETSTVDYIQPDVK